MAKKKKKPLITTPVFFYVPGIAPTIRGVPNIIPTITEDQVKETIKSIPDYMPMWKAWLLYSAYTAGMPMGHENLGALLGVKLAKKMGVRAVIGGGVGYLAAILVVGSLATALDPLDYYEGGMNMTPAQMQAAGSAGLSTFTSEFLDPSPIIRGRLNPLGLRTGWK
jgi:hypothetical protein